MQEKVTLNRKEQKRAMVMSEVDRGVVRGREAAAMLEVSLRHLRRMMAAYRREGVAALAHGNRGRKPANAIGDDVRRSVVDLASGKYLGFNQQHMTELLAEREEIRLSRSTVRSILLGSGIRSPQKRRPPKHRSRRDRYPQEGMLLQIDGSPHDWLQGRGPWISLIGAIDDATGKVPYALFREQEDSYGYFLLMQAIVGRRGTPLAVYHDGHSIFEVTREEPETIQDQLTGRPMLTQFGRLMQELDITPIPARSPQAKGRIERLWRTFQDRLVNEMRLAAVCTLDEANRFLAGFLERYNARFAVPPKEPGLAYRSTHGLNLDTLFCFKYERVVGADNVVRFLGHRLQILPSLDRISYARCNVEVHQQLDASLRIWYRGKYLDTCEAAKEATGLRKPVPVPTRPIPQVVKPAKDHPWRRWEYRTKGEQHS
jgi:transposase